MTDKQRCFADLRPDSNPISLSKTISAIQLLPDDEGGARLGLLLQLGPGTTVEPCGQGFNERTTKVYANGHFYFVFSEDLQLRAAVAR